MSRAVRMSRHRMSIHQAAAIWVLVFLIGLTGGELVRQQTLNAKAVAVTSGPTDPTTATPAPAANAAARSATYPTSPPQTTTTIECDAGSCLGDRGKEESRSEGDESGRAHGKRGMGRGHSKGAASGAG